MSRIRKTLVVLSLVLSITAIQVPASADPVTDEVEQASCWLQEELEKYGWNGYICLSFPTP